MVYQGLFWLDRRFSRRRRIRTHFTISVGNLTLGGTGKTPFLQYLVKILQRQISPITILSRGYGGSMSKDGSSVPELGEPKFYGDEPVLHKNKFPNVQMIIGKNRYKSFSKYNLDSSGFVILDDGFQHHALERDLDIVLLDGERPLGNGFTLPLGSLREPYSHLVRAHAIVLTKTEPSQEFLKSLGRDFPETPVFWAKAVQRKLVPRFPIPNPSPTSIHLVTGVGNPKSVVRSLEEIGIKVLTKNFFRDHHPFSPQDLESLRDVRPLAMTTKDWIKWQSLDQGKDREGIFVLEEEWGASPGFEEWFLEKTSSFWNRSDSA